MVEMSHEKTGAELCWIDNGEVNKTFSIAFKTLPEDSTGVSISWNTPCCAVRISIR